MARLIDRVDGPMQLMIRLLYGTGMRLMELVRLRVKDVEFERLEITIRDGKGAKDRVTMLPGSLAEPLQAPRGMNDPWVSVSGPVALLTLGRV